MKLASANLCMFSRGGCVKCSVQLGLCGLGAASLALLSFEPLQAVLDIHHPASWCMLAYLLLGMRSCWCLTRALVLLGLGLVLAASPLSPVGLSIISSLSGLGFLYIAMIPFGQLVTLVLYLVVPQGLYDAQPQRIERFLEYLPSLDVVAIQELTVSWGCDAHVQRIRRFAHTVGLKHFASSGRWPDWPAFYCAAGLVVLSKYPIRRSLYFSFSRQAWFEWSAIQRGALMVELDTPQGKVALLNVHTTAGLEVLETGVGRKSLAGKVNPVGLDQLLEALSRFTDFSRGADQRIFCGDFNLSKDSPAFKRFQEEARALHLVDVFPNSPPTFGAVDDDGKPLETLVTKKTTQGNPRVIDHVFSDKVCTHAAVDHMLASPEAGRLHGFQAVSDHSALEVTF
ncbi:unnamed protein product [Effrenium voratum]|nr:unnamed protein product [Effrenium voratum]